MNIREANTGGSLPKYERFTYDDDLVNAIDGEMSSEPNNIKVEAYGGSGLQHGVTCTEPPNPSGMNITVATTSGSLPKYDGIEHHDGNHEASVEPISGAMSSVPNSLLNVKTCGGTGNDAKQCLGKKKLHKKPEPHVCSICFKEITVANKLVTVDNELVTVYNKLVIAPCSHPYHSACLSYWVGKRKNIRCRLCQRFFGHRHIDHAKLESKCYTALQFQNFMQTETFVNNNLRFKQWAETVVAQKYAVAMARRVSNQVNHWPKLKVYRFARYLLRYSATLTNRVHLRDFLNRHYNPGFIAFMEKVIYRAGLPRKKYTRTTHVQHLLGGNYSGQ